MPYTPLAAAEDEEGEEEGTMSSGPQRGVALSVADKWRLVKPLIPKYMLPLCKPPFILLFSTFLSELLTDLRGFARGFAIC